MLSSGPSLVIFYFSSIKWWPVLRRIIQYWSYQGAIQSLYHFTIPEGKVSFNKTEYFVSFAVFFSMCLCNFSELYIYIYSYIFLQELASNHVVVLYIITSKMHILAFLTTKRTIIIIISLSKISSWRNIIKEKEEQNLKKFVLQLIWWLKRKSSLWNTFLKDY